MQFLCVWLAKLFVCRFTERNDTYIFVPEGDAQSLTVNRSSGELSLNCRSYLSDMYDLNTDRTCSTYIHDSIFGAPFGHCNLWDHRFNFPINMYKLPSSVVEPHHHLIDITLNSGLYSYCNRPCHSGPTHGS